MKQADPTSKQLGKKVVESKEGIEGIVDMDEEEKKGKYTKNMFLRVSQCTHHWFLTIQYGGSATLL